MAIIYTQNKIKKNIKKIIVDDHLYHYLNSFKWYASGPKGYAYSNVLKTTMHRFLLGLTKGDNIQGDHINRNTFDNRLENLRRCTLAQNAVNRNPRGTSKYMGVNLVNSGSWRAQLHHNRIKYTLGYYENEEDAAKAYDKKAIEMHGEFANLNFKQLTNI